MRRPWAFVAAALLGLTACADDPTGARSATMAVIPTSPGDTWTYRWRDIKTGAVDTVTVTMVSGTGLAADASTDLMVFEHPAWTETVLVSVRGDTVEFTPSKLFPGIASRFVLPLTVGATWSEPGPWSSPNVNRCTVSGEESLVVPVGSFRHVFRLQQERTGFNHLYYAWVVTWIVPEIGIVKEYSYVGAGFYSWYERELISYRLRPARL